MRSTSSLFWKSASSRSSAPDCRSAWSSASDSSNASECSEAPSSSVSRAVSRASAVVVGAGAIVLVAFAIPSTLYLPRANGPRLASFADEWHIVLALPLLLHIDTRLRVRMPQPRVAALHRRVAGGCEHLHAHTDLLVGRRVGR